MNLWMMTGSVAEPANGIAVTLLMLAGGVALLYFGAEWLVKGGVRVARRLGVSPLVIGLTLVAAATSAPELVVSVDAALKGNADISLGNVVGSNICNIALILGLAALITPLAVKPQLLRFDLPVLIAVSAALALAVWWLGGIPRWVGVLFLAGLAAYTVRNVAVSRREGAAAELPEEACAAAAAWRGWRSWLWCLALVGGGIAALIAGANFLVDAAVDIGRAAGVSDAVIGLTVVAVGTSLPELATSVVAACRKEQDIAIGNVVGSNIFNILCIMGATPLIRPLGDTGITGVDWAMMLGTAVVLLPFMLTGRRLSRAEGGALLALYIGYIVWLIASNG